MALSLTCGIAAWVIDLYGDLLVKLHHQATVIRLFASQVWAGGGRQPQEMVVAVEVAGEEQVCAERRDVIRKVPNGDVVVPGQRRGRSLQPPAESGTGVAKKGT